MAGASFCISHFDHYCRSARDCVYRGRAREGLASFRFLSGNHSRAEGRLCVFRTCERGLCATYSRMRGMKNFYGLRSVFVSNL